MYGERYDQEREDIKEAISVPGDHACRNDPEGMCSFSAAISDQLMLVENKKYASCPHFISFGYSGFCNSAIRKNIYDKYRV